MAKGFGGRGGARPGGGGFGQMQSMMKQASKMQGKIKEAQEEAEKKEYELESAGGAIKIKITGNQKILSLSIDQALMDDRETLEDALLVAANEAIHKSHEETKKIVDKASEGFNIPGLF